MGANPTIASELAPHWCWRQARERNGAWFYSWCLFWQELECSWMSGREMKRDLLGKEIKSCLQRQRYERQDAEAQSNSLCPSIVVSPVFEEDCSTMRQGQQRWQSSANVVQRFASSWWASISAVDLLLITTILCQDLPKACHLPRQTQEIWRGWPKIKVTGKLDFML